MEQKQNNCCTKTKDKTNKGFLLGVLYGIIPHSFCIAFILFSIVGAVTATAFLKKFMLVPNFFYFLLLISLVLATASAAIYLKRANCLCVSGIKNKWKYLSTLYATTLFINLMMFFVVFPALANINPKGVSSDKETNLAELSINVQIPCTGHAPLIIDEIKKNFDVQSVKFETPNTFEIEYNPEKTTPEKIASLEIFKTYEAKIN